MVENRFANSGDSFGLEFTPDSPIPPQLPPNVARAILPGTPGAFWYDPVVDSQEQTLEDWYSSMEIVIPGPELFLGNILEYVLGGNYVEGGDNEFEGLLMRIEVTLDDPPTGTVYLEHVTGPIGGPYVTINQSVFPGYEFIADVDQWLLLEAFITQSAGIGIIFNGNYSQLLEIWDIINRQKARAGTNLMVIYQEQPSVETYPYVDNFIVDDETP